MCIPILRTTPGEWLRIHRLLMRLVFAGVNAFAWVIIFWFFSGVTGSTSLALARTAGLFALMYVVVALVTPYAGMLLQGGMRRGMLYGTLFAAAAYVCLGAAFDPVVAHVEPTLGFVLFAVSLGAYRALYWVPYSVEVSEVELSPRKMPLWFEAPHLLAPLVVGLFLFMHQDVHLRGESYLFYAAAVGLVVSALPLLCVREQKEWYPWSHRSTFAELFSQKTRSVISHSFLQGVQSTALLFVWPVVVFLALHWSYPQLGAVLALTSFVVLLLRRLVRKWLRATRIDRSPLVQSVIVVSAWIMRTAVGSPIGIVLVDVYQSLSAPESSWHDATTRDVAADSGMYVDEYTALKEVGHAIGSVVLCVAIIVLASSLSFSALTMAVFLNAAGAGVLSMRSIRKNSGETV